MSENEARLGEHHLERELDARKEAESMLINALRQYQHNDGGGLVVGFDYHETIKIVENLFQKIQTLHRDIDRKTERSLMMRKYLSLHQRIDFENEWQEYMKSV